MQTTKHWTAILKKFVCNSIRIVKAVTAATEESRAIMEKRGLKKIYYLSSTHWDREWYRPFQGFRYRLVKVVNTVIDVLEKDPDFKTFIFDGQTVVLDDYTKIEPGKKERLKKLIAEKRIKVGPWYVMPDEFLVSGESLIRNLLMGDRLSHQYGANGPMKYGYICDIFGHVAQMPQILNQFGIKGALLGRGTNLHTTESHFLWEAPDGSRCTTFKVPEECGYGTFWLDVWLPYYFDGREEGLVERACRYIDSEKERSPLPFVVLMDGMDHEGIHAKAPWLAKQLEKIYGCPVVFESLDAIPEDLEPYQSEMPVKMGELNETAKRCVEHNMLITYTLSSRYDIKKSNDQCQTMMEKWAQPCAVLSAWKGVPLQKTYLDEAYRQIIKCHAHDSICGCSVDQVHQDMHYRFRQADAIAKELIWDTLYNMSVYSRKEEKSEEYVLTVLNPLPFERREVIQAEIWFQPGYSHSYCEQAKVEFRNAFRLLDRDGKEVSYVITDLQKGKFVNVLDSGYRRQCDCYTISFLADLAPCGLTEYRVVPSDVPVRCLKRLSDGFRRAENDSMWLEIEDNGTITLADKRSGKVYRDLLSYMDDADIGDGWFYGKPVNDRSVSSRGFPCGIEQLYDHRDVCAFRITSYLRLPEESNGDSNHWARNGRDLELKILSIITFYKEARYIDVRTEVDNRAKDHRLRLLLPTGIAGGSYYASQAFAFIERKCGIDSGTCDWKESEKYEKSFDSVVFKRNEDGEGLAFLSAGGLHECAGLDDSQGTLAITLFRAFQTTFLTNGEPDGELQGRLEFRYRIQLLSKGDSFADLIRSEDTLKTGIQFNSFPIKPGSPLLLSEPLVSHAGKNTAVSILKLPEDGGENSVILRLSNYSGEPSTAELRYAGELEKVYCTDLLEQNIAEVKIGNPIVLELPPWRITTLRLIWKA